MASTLSFKTKIRIPFRNKHASLNSTVIVPLDILDLIVKSKWCYVRMDNNIVPTAPSVMLIMLTVAIAIIIVVVMLNIPI